MASKKELKTEIVELRKQLVKQALEIETLKLRIGTLEARPPVIIRGPLWEPADKAMDSYKITWNPPTISTDGPFFLHRYIQGGKYS